MLNIQGPTAGSEWFGQTSMVHDTQNMTEVHWK